MTDIKPALTVISLGWGVQSFTLAAMAALGALPPVDFAVHADTLWEHEHTNEFAAQWTPWLEERGVKVVTVEPNRGGWGFTEGPGVFIPAYTISVRGKTGRLRRQCTGDWKIDPMRRFISAELKRRGLKKSKGVVDVLLGISLDEWKRAKDNDVQYIRNRFPLLDMGMDRAACLTWLAEHGLPSPGKSACVFCPYRSNKEWEDLKRKGGADWERAVQVDEEMRNKRGNPIYVHRSCRPLGEAVTILEDEGMSQMLLTDDDIPCDSGHCFL